MILLRYPWNIPPYILRKCRSRRLTVDKYIDRLHNLDDHEQLFKYNPDKMVSIPAGNMVVGEERAVASLLLRGLNTYNKYTYTSSFTALFRGVYNLAGVQIRGGIIHTLNDLPCWSNLLLLTKYSCTKCYRLAASWVDASNDRQQDSVRQLFNLGGYWLISRVAFCRSLCTSATWLFES